MLKQKLFYFKQLQKPNPNTGYKVVRIKSTGSEQLSCGISISKVSAERINSE